MRTLFWINTLDIVVSLGIALSLFLATLIISSKSFRSDIHLYFAATIIALSCMLTYTWFETYVPSNGVMEIISWDFLFPFAFLLYVLKAIKHPLSSSRKILLLIIPCIILSLLQAIVFFFDFDLFYWLSNGDEEKMLWLIEIRSFSFLPFSIALIGFSYLKIRTATTIYPKEKKWLVFNSVAMLVLLVSWVLGDSIPVFFDFPFWEYSFAWLGIFLVAITYMGVHQLNIAEQQRYIKVLRQADSSTLEPDAATKKQVRIEQERTDVSQKIEDNIHRLHDLMLQHQLYNDPNLTRTIVAQKLRISEGYLSELLKTVLNTNFNDYINEFRVRQVIELFHNKDFDIFSIEAIGVEAGFKSKSVFYAAFKKVTKKTPGAYRKALNLS